MSQVEHSLKGQVVVLTGGAGGIGTETAKALAAAGAKVAIGDLDGDAAVKLAASLGEGHFGGILDVTDYAGFEKFVDDAEAELGSLYALVNNAGLMPLNPFDEEPRVTTELQINVNLYGVINGTQIAMKKLKPLKRGQIVNIASLAGKTGYPGGATYCATKFAVVGLSEAVRNELHGTGVGVTCVMPGVVDTRLGAGLSQPGFVDLVKPGEVAEGVVRGIVDNRPEVWLPKMTRGMIPVVQLLPAKVRDRMSRVLGTDKTLADPDHEIRAEYEKEVAG
jgi:NAD(P)-dependent dehydrogenase (short-subunit alcohol dehydrogenase family)